MTITGGSALAKDEIDRMVQEAEAHAAEDKARREEQDTRNMAEQTVYSMEKLLKDNADKITEGTRSEVQDAIDATKKALEGDDVAEVKKQLENLNEVGMKIGQEVYAASSAEESAQAAPEADASADEDVVDAEIIDDEEDTK